MYGLGLLSKNTLVTLPFVLLLLDYWPLQRFKVPGFGFRVQSLVLEKIPLFLLSAGSCVTTAMVLGKMSPSNYLPLWLRVENAPVAYVTYLWQMICPAGLVIPYPYPANTVSLWQAALALVLLVVPPFSDPLLLAVNRQAGDAVALGYQGRNCSAGVPTRAFTIDRYQRNLGTGILISRVGTPALQGRRTVGAGRKGGRKGLLERVKK